MREKKEGEMKEKKDEKFRGGYLYLFKDRCYRGPPIPPSVPPLGTLSVPRPVGPPDRGPRSPPRSKVSVTCTVQ